MNDLRISHLTVRIDGKIILNDLNLSIKPGEIHAIMGPNGSGKSTLALTLSGYPKYKTDAKSQVKIGINDLLKLSPENRAKKGLYMAFQEPVAIPGVNFLNFLRLASNNISIHNKTSSLADFFADLKKYAKKLNIHEDLLRRSLNDDLSGGEKKKMECLQAVVLQPKYAIFDEIDTGLDIDALKTVASTIKTLSEKNTGIILITHYQRILKYLNPDKIHILIDGKIVKSGDQHLAVSLEKTGYSEYIKAQ